MIYQKDTSEYLDFIITLKKDFKIRESSNFVEIISSNVQKLFSCIVQNCLIRCSMTRLNCLNTSLKSGFRNHGGKNSAGN